jgi:hypothetical protein
VPCSKAIRKIELLQKADFSRILMNFDLYLIFFRCLSLIDIYKLISTCFEVFKNFMNVKKGLAKICQPLTSDDAYPSIILLTFLDKLACKKWQITGTNI